MLRNIVERFKKWRNGRRESKALREVVRAISKDYGKLSNALYDLFGDTRNRAVWDKARSAHRSLFQNIVRSDLIKLSSRLRIYHGLPVVEYFDRPSATFSSTVASDEDEVVEDEEVSLDDATQTDSGEPSFEQQDTRGGEDPDAWMWEYLNTPQSDNIYSYNEYRAAKRLILFYNFFQHYPVGAYGMERFLTGHTKEEVKTIGEVVAIATVMVALMQANNSTTAVMLEGEEVHEA